MDEGAQVSVEGESIADNGTAMAKDGTIVFSAWAKEGYEITSVLVDGEKDARHNGDSETEYIIENIKTDETVVSVSTRALDTEEPEEQPGEESVVKKTVTFQVAEGAAVTVDGEDVPDGGTAMAKDGTIIFSAYPMDGYEITSVLFDGDHETRKTSSESGSEYIIEGIQTDETIISVSARPMEKPEEDSSVVKKIVTFEVAKGAAVTADGENIPDGGTAMAKDGTIVFSASPKKGYEITSVLFDGDHETRKTSNESGNEYIIEGIQTDETIVSVSAQAIETEAETETETEAQETETETEAKKKSDKVYLLSIRHVLNTGTIGSFEDVEEVSLTADDFADGGYNVLQNAYEREGMVVLTPELVVTEKDFYDYGRFAQGMATIEYGVAEGYRAERLPKDGIMQMDVYSGHIDEVTFIPIEQISVKVNVYVNKVLASTETVAKEKEEGSGSYSFSYKIAEEYAGYELDRITPGSFKFESGIVSAEGLQKQDESYVVDVYLKAPLVPYTIEYKDTEEKTLRANDTGSGIVNDMTEVDPPEIEHYIVSEYSNQIIKPDGTTTVTIIYEPKTYHVFYNTDGGSYVSPKSGKYQDEVEVYSWNAGGRVLTCTTEEHTHNWRQCGVSWGGYQCGKEEHTHNEWEGCYSYVPESYSPTPTKQGYTFDGWYKDASCTERADQSVTLEDNVTVYAKWEPQNANYRIVYMKEMLDEHNDPHYAYISSFIRTAQVDSTVTATGSTQFSDSKYYDNGHPGDSAVVKADGSTVVYYYYDLKEYTYIFNISNGSATLHMGGNEYKNSEYTFTVKFGMNIADMWPTKDCFMPDTQKDRFNGWDPSHTETNYVTKRYIVTEEMLPKDGNSGSITFKGRWSGSVTSHTVEYWLQNVSGNGYTKSVEHSESYNSSSNSLGAKEIAGFTKRDRIPSGGYTGSSGNTFRFYYDRNRYTITFMDRDKELKTTEEIYFGANIAGQYYTPKNNTPGQEDYIFDGWYDNPDCAGNAYGFGTMPSEDKVLYAKWRAPERTVTFHKNDGSNEKREIVVSKNSVVGALPEFSRPGYIFSGWYYEEKCETEFDASAPIIDHTNVYAKWEESTIAYYTIKYLESGTNRYVHPPVTKSGKVGNVVSARAVTVEDYVADRLSAELTVNADSEKNEIIFYYTKVSDLKYTRVYKYGEKSKKKGEVIEEDSGLPVLGTTFAVSANEDVVEKQASEGYSLVGEGIERNFKPTAAGNNIVTFYFEPTEFTISYTGIDEITGWENGSEKNPNPGKYTVESDEIHIVNPKKEGYNFVGWKMLEGTSSETHVDKKKEVTISEGTKGNIGFEAVWEPIETSVTVKKVWDDGDSADTEHSPVTVELLCDGKKTEEKSIVLNDENDWSGTWEHLDQYYLDRLPLKEHTYTVQEQPVEDYIISDISYVWNEMPFEPKRITATITNTRKKPSLEVTKTASKTADAKLNDVITYTITVANNGNVTVSDITVTDPLTGLEESVGTLAPGASIEAITTTYTVKETDILEGSFVNTATAKGTDPDGKEVTGVGTATVTTVDQNPVLTVTKTADKTEGAALDEEITYTITVTNSGNVTVKDITVTDQQTGLNQSAGTLAPGGSTSVTTTHKITEEDILAGNFVNTATATGKDPKDGKVTGSDDETVTTVEQAPALTVVKTANKTSGAALDEEITYTITVTNSGNVTVSDITVTDPLTKLEKSVGTLAPGKDASVTTTHKITEEDILKGSFENTATATGTDPNGEEVTGSGDETVTTVEQAPALTVVKTANKTTGAALNEEITYTITVTNSGNVTVSDITVTDPLTELEESVGTLAPGEDASVTTTHKITEEDILKGSFVNTATATGTDPNGGEITGSDDETVTTVEQAPALTVVKTADKTSGAELNDVITYTITVTNSGNMTVSDITVTDPLTKLEKSVGTLVPGASAETITTTYTVQEKDILAGKIENTATATGTDPNGGEVTGCDDETVMTKEQAPALTVVKTADKTSGVALGGEITYTITVTNSGNVTVSDITVTDPLTDLNQSAGTLAPGASAEAITTTYTVQEKDILAGKIENTATATGTDPNGEEVTGSDNETVTTAAQAPALTVVKTADKTSGTSLDEEITYTITVTNSGNVTVSDITVTDPLTGLEKRVGTLAPGASAEAIKTTYKVKEKDILKGKIENTATATGTDPNGEKVTGSDDKTVTTAAQAPALTVEKKASKTSGAALNEEITYTIKVTNSGNVTVSDITVTDPLTELNQSAGTLAPGEDASVTTTHKITEADILAGNFVNTATATGTDPNGGEVTGSDDETVTTVAQAPALRVEKTADKTSGVELNGVVTYTIKVTNSGNVTVKDITVTDPLTELNQSVGTLAPGASAEAIKTTYTVQEKDILAGKIENTATARGTDPKGGEVTGAGTATITTADQKPVLTVTKTADKAKGAELNDVINYTITVKNEGNVTVNDITVDDPLTGLNQSVGTLAPGGSTSVITTHKITEEDILNGSFENTATATGTDLKGDEVTDSDNATVTTAAQAPALTVEKTADKTTGVELNGVVTYTITVTNSGNVTVSDITVTDPLTGLEKSVGTLAPGKDASVTTTHAITEEDILKGSFENTATAKGTDPDGKEVTGAGTATVTTVDQNPVLTVTKTADKTEGAELNDVINYTITVENEGNVTVKEITVDDPLTGLEQNVGTLAPGENTSVTTTHKITEEDILKGSFENTATATGTDPNGGEVTGSDDETVTTIEQAPALTVEKTADKTSGAELNDVITYTITVTNSGNVTVSDITVTDPKTGLEESVGTLAPGEVASVATTHTITEEDILAGSFVNTATATGTDPNGGEVTGSDDETVTTVAQDPALTVVKTASKESGAALNEEITYTITVTNSGNVTVSGIMVTDPKTGLEQNVGTLAPGEDASVTTTHTITEADILDGSFVNMAAAAGTDPNGGEVTDSDEETVTTVEKNPALEITKGVKDKNYGYDFNDTVEYYIHVENTGNLTLTNVKVTDPLTEDEWTIESLAPGENVPFETKAYTVTEEDIHAGIIINTASAVCENPEVSSSASVSVRTVEQRQHLTISKTVSENTPPAEGAYKLGETITYIITAKNDGNVTLNDVKVTDELTGNEWTIDVIAPGESREFETSYDVTEKDILAGHVLNVATTTDDDVPVTPGEDDEPTQTPNPSLFVEKTAAQKEGGYELGEEITFHIKVTNNGNVTISDVTVSDVKAGLSEFKVGSLAPLGFWEKDVTYKVTEKDVLEGSVKNTAYASGLDPDGNRINKSGDAVVPTALQKPGLEVTKYVLEHNAGYELGDTVKYHVSVKNTGNLTLTDVKVTDNLTRNSWTIGSLAPGEEKDYWPEYKVTEENILNGSFVNTAEAAGKASNGESVEDDDAAKAYTVKPDPHITITKETSSTPANGEMYALGEKITYEITATNDGNVTVTDVAVTDELTGNTGENAWTIKSLAPGASETFTAEYVVTEKDILAGSVVNVATGTGTGPDPNTPPTIVPGEKEDPTGPKNGHLTITKETTSTPENGEAYALGEKITYRITVTNDGNLTLTNVAVKDALTGDNWTVESLAPGASETFTAEYVVTEKDILKGNVVNKATGRGTSPDPKEPNVPATPGEKEDPTGPKNGHLTIKKETTSTPANGKAYALGERIVYSITATNDGNLTLTNIVVRDELTKDVRTITSLAPGASVSFTVVYVVTEADILAGKVLNVATATGTSPDPETPPTIVPGEKEDPTDPKNGHLTVTKEATSTPENGQTYALGETITYSITAKNDGNLTLTDVTVTDELTGDAWTIESLAPDASETFTASYVVTEADILDGSVLNVATATGTSPDPEKPEVPVDPGKKEDPTDPKNGHLKVTKEATSTPKNGETYALGETITYSITAKNDGNLTLTDVTVTDELTGDTWTIESLAPDASETFTAEYVVTEADILAGKVVNEATAKGTSPDPDEPEVPVDPGEKEDPTDPKNGHLTITKTTTSTPANGETYALGETITYEITAKNDGNLTVTDVTVTDALTGDAWTIESLAPDASETFTAEYVVTEADILKGSVVNEATAAGTSPDPKEPEVPVDPGEKEDPTDPKNGHLTITKTTTSTPENGKTYALGETITYEIIAKNDGNLTLTDVTVTDELTGDAWTIESLAPDASETFTAEYVVTEADILEGSVVNEATAAGTSPDPDEPEVPVDPGEEEVPTDPKNGHLTVTKEATSTPENGKTYALGETITYSITATNDGNLTLTEVTVTDELTGNTGENAWTIESLEPGASETFTTEYVVTEADILEGKVVNEATAAGTSPDPDKPDVPVEPGETEDPTDPKNGHLTIAKTTTSEPANGTTYGLGETITYEITATNDGNLTLTDITVTDELTGNTGENAWTIESLEPGESEKFTASYVVTEADILEGKVVNEATAAGTSPDPDKPEVPVDPGEKEDPTQTPAPSLFVEKTAEQKLGGYTLNDIVTYTIEVTNNGNVTLTDVVVTDPLTGLERKIGELKPNEAYEEKIITSYTVNEADILKGNIENTVSVVGLDPNKNEVTETASVTVTTVSKNGHVKITKTTTSTPANGKDYVLGETIAYSITAENDGNLTLTDVVVTDELTGDAWTIESFAPGASKTFTAEHVVTEADILAGSVVNEATATGTSPDPDEPDVPVEPGETEDPTDPKNGHLTIVKTTTSEPANGEAYVLGETIAYSITAENDGNLTLTDVVVTDELTGDTWTIESLEPDASETFTTEYAVTEEDILAGKVVNKATATGTSPDPETPPTIIPGETEDPTDPKNGHLTITKTTTSTPANGEAYVLGETITYSITAENDGNLTLTGVTVTDELTGDEWTIESLEPKASKTFTAEHEVTEEDILAGSVVNVATATGTSPDPDEPEVPVDPGEKEDPTDPKNGHLTITKTTTSTPANGEAYVLGETIAYSITAENDGNLTLTDVTVTDELTGDAWTIESLAPKASETFEAKYVVTEADILAGSVVNVATAEGTSPDPEEPEVPVDPGEKEDPTEQKNGHLTVTKEATSTPENGETYALGETVTYEITAENDGNLTLTDVTVTDALTGDAWTIAGLAPGESRTFTAEYVVTEADILAGSVVNVATAEGTSPDPDEPEVPVDPGEEEVPTEPKDGHLTVTKEVTSTPENGETYALGETVTYEITAENNGNLTLTDVTVTDELTGDAWTIESLAPGASETFEAEYVVTEADILAGSVVNVATAEGTSPDPDEPEVPVDPGEEEVPTEPKDGHLTITKTTTSTPANGAAYDFGETITYSITATNDGNLTLTNVEVTDALTGNTGENAWTIETLAPGESRTFTASYVVTDEDILAGSVMNVAAASGTSPDADEPDVPVDPDEEEVPTQTPAPSLFVEKTAAQAAGGYALGDVVTYTIRVVNNGNVDVNDITVTDALTGDEWTIESLAPATAETFTAEHMVTEADILAGSITNVAAAAGTDPDGNAVEDDGSVTVTTEATRGHITVTKVTTSAPANGTAYALGETITYGVTATNDGNLTITDVTVTDGLTGDVWTAGTLAPGASQTFTASHVVTEADISAGSVVNTATAAGTSPDPDAPDVSVTPGSTEDPTEDRRPALTVDKAVTSTPASASGRYAVGETVSYQVTVTNTGNLTLENITLEDMVTRPNGAQAVPDGLAGGAAAIGTLAPGESASITYSYVVTEADLGGILVNNAAAAGTPAIPDPTPETPDPAAEDSDSVAVETEDPLNSSITVSKTNVDGLTDALLSLPGAQFYVALFADEQLTQMVGGVQTLTFAEGQATASAAFTGLPRGTYYIAETDAAGNVLTSGEYLGGSFVPEYAAGQQVVITENGQNVSIAFRNLFATLPELEFSRMAELTITKEVKDTSGAPMNSDETFYAGLFADEACTVPAEGVSQQVIPLAMNGGSTASAAAEVTILNDGSDTVVYVAEVTADGTPVANAADFAYAVTVEGGKVTVNMDSPEASAKITNVTDEMRTDYYKAGELTITKEVRNAKGRPANSDKTFYAGIFRDASYTNLADNVSEPVVALDMQGASKMSETVEVTLTDDGKDTVLYVTEVTKDGKPVAGSRSFAYEVTVEGGTVVMNGNAPEGSVKIINTKASGEEPEETETEEPETDKPDKDNKDKEDQSMSESETEGPQSIESVKTGDETPLTMWTILFLAAALAMFLTAVSEVRRRRSR